MMSRRSRLALLSLIAGGIALAGCASNPTSPTPATTTHAKSQTAGGSSATSSPARTGGSSGSAATRSKPAGTPPTSGSPQPGSTGIPACDDYLASYVACHRTAAIYPPDQIEGHYEAMRDSLMRDAQDPNTRPQLGGRCTSLAQTLRQALHGKACGPTNAAPPAPASSTGH